MLQLDSAIENQVFELNDLENKLKPLNFIIGSNWEYDHGYFDYPFQSKETYYFLRIPFNAEIGQLDEPGVQVRVGRPFLLGHQYASGTDEDAMIGNVTAPINQFQSPVDPDTEVPEDIQSKGDDLIKTVEHALLS
ncbi:YugN-like family protein [Salinibacillus kushneri]|uniref:YugN-like family protein n=1 Tax=Salinibacillus kushneri TaxID=237682 RepID=A0A1H9Y6H0_9BACI|nr:YugN family protein [Salinibacillus kushneri]SES64418.1 YugN-like family protein [Salinibacillus kushneri]